MNTQVIRAIRVIAPSDMRLIWRDGFLLTFLIVAMPLVGLWLHWLAPFVGDLVAQWVELEPYYGLILANVVVAGEPVLLGFVIGMLFVEERDEGTLLALQASPLSLRTFVGYRLLVGMVLNVLLTMIGVLLTRPRRYRPRYPRAVTARRLSPRTPGHGGPGCSAGPGRWRPGR